MSVNQPDCLAGTRSSEADGEVQMREAVTQLGEVRCAKRSCSL